MNLIFLLLSSGTFLSPNNIIEKLLFKALYRKVQLSDKVENQYKVIIKLTKKSIS